MPVRSNAPQHPSWSSLSKAEQKQIALHLTGLERTVDVKPPARQKGQFQLRGYIRCELSSADKDAFRLWEELQAADALYNRVVALVDGGYLFKSGAGKDGYQASLSALETAQAWDGYVLTAFAGAAGRAIALLVYKHAIMMQEDWSAWLEEPGEDFIR